MTPLKGAYSAPLQSNFTSMMGFPTYTDYSGWHLPQMSQFIGEALIICDPNVFNQPPAYSLKIRREWLFEIMKKHERKWLKWAQL